LSGVSLAYQQKNVAPAIDGISLQDAGVRVQGQANLSAGGNQPAVLKFPPALSASGVVILNQAQRTPAA